MSDYPSINELIDIENLPSDLGGLSINLSNLLDDIFYDKFGFTTGANNAAKVFSLSLLLNKELGFEIPGSGMRLLLNHGASGYTELPY